MAAARASHERAEPTSARARSDSARPRLDPATLSRCPDRVRDGSSPSRRDDPDDEARRSLTESDRRDMFGRKRSPADPFPSAQ